MRAVQSPVNYKSQHSVKWIILQSGTRRRKAYLVCCSWWLGRRCLDKGSSSFFVLLSVRYPLSSSPVRPVPPCFFFFPWFPLCSSPGRCLRFPVSHGFLCFLGFSSFVFPLCSRPSSSFSVSFNPSSVLVSFFFDFFSPQRWLLRGFL